MDGQKKNKNKTKQSLLDIQGASGHSVVPVSQLAVLGANHTLSSGLVHSAIQHERMRAEEKKEKTPEKIQKKDLDKAL